MRRVVCLVNLEAILVGCLGVSVKKVYLAGVVNKKKLTPGFGLQVMLRVSLCVSFPCIFHIYCGTRSKPS